MTAVHDSTDLRVTPGGQRWVVKLGTSTVTSGGPAPDVPRLLDLVRQIVGLRAGGRAVVLVSSGAVACGRQCLSARPAAGSVPQKQMWAAIGQPRLMALYQQLFGHYGVAVAQVLLTRADLEHRRRYLNARNTLTALLAHDVVPIVNENDTVATEEIRVGDNDNLSALVAGLVDADVLCLLTDQDGLYERDPRRFPDARLIGEVRGARIPKRVWAAAGDGSASGQGTGGMRTKLQAADLARRGGCRVHIVSGRAAEVLTRLAAGEALGTVIEPAIARAQARQRYLLAAGRHGGAIRIDAGAARALRQGSSLLPVGVRAVEGRFERGDGVRVLDPRGRELARGISNYSSVDLLKIAGVRSDGIEVRLGYDFGAHVIHRDDLVLL